jgi:hypothetical protein
LQVTGARAQFAACFFPNIQSENSNLPSRL